MAGLKDQDVDAICQQSVAAQYTATGMGRNDFTELDNTRADHVFPIQHRHPHGNLSTRGQEFEAEGLKLSLSFDHPYAVIVMVDDGSMWTGTPISTSWIKEVA